MQTGSANETDRRRAPTRQISFNNILIIFRIGEISCLLSEFVLSE